MNFTPKDVERFMAKVGKADTGCWLWLSSTSRTGYGTFWLDKRVRPAHRVSFLLHGGDFTTMQKWVLHRCDVKLCVNPAHLYAGDINDNARDASARGQQVRGGQVAQARLTATQVSEIRESNLSQAGVTQALAARFGVSYDAVRDASDRRTWRHVP